MLKSDIETRPAGVYGDLEPWMGRCSILRKQKGAVDARKENISELKGQLAEFQTLKGQYATDLKGFISELNKLEASASNAPASEKRDGLQTHFQDFLDR